MYNETKLAHTRSAKKQECVRMTTVQLLFTLWAAPHMVTNDYSNIRVCNSLQLTVSMLWEPPLNVCIPQLISSHSNTVRQPGTQDMYTDLSARIKLSKGIRIPVVSLIIQITFPTVSHFICSPFSNQRKTQTTQHGVTSYRTECLHEFCCFIYLGLHVSQVHLVCRLQVADEKLSQGSC